MSETKQAPAILTDEEVNAILANDSERTADVVGLCGWLNTRTAFAGMVDEATGEEYEEPVFGQMQGPEDYLIVNTDMAIDDKRFELETKVIDFLTLAEGVEGLFLTYNYDETAPEETRYASPTGITTNAGICRDLARHGLETTVSITTSAGSEEDEEDSGMLAFVSVGFGAFSLEF